MGTPASDHGEAGSFEPALSNIRSFFSFSGDVVVVTAPDNPSLRICKRIMALEGDRVSYTPGEADADEYGLV